MGDVSYLFLSVIIDELRHKRVDVGIPLQISAESMKRTYHPEFIQVSVVAEQIDIVLFVFQYSFLLPDLLE